MAALLSAGDPSTAPPPRSISPQPFPVKRLCSRSPPRSSPSRAHSPIDISFISSSPIPQTSLYTYPSHSSLVSIYSAHSRSDPVKLHTDTSRCATPASIDEDSTRFVAVIAPVSIVAPSGPLPATPPPGEIGLSDEDEDEGEDGMGNEVEELGQSKQLDSSRQSLRRVRGRILGPAEPLILTTEDIVMADTVPTSNRRGSAQLHHPKPLRGSPKSAYFEDEYELDGRRDSKTLPFEEPGIPIPDSPLERTSNMKQDATHEQVSENAQAAKMSKKLEAVLSTANEEGHPRDYKKERIVGAGGRKMTPWPTPRVLSFDTPQDNCPNGNQEGSGQDDDESAVDDSSTVEEVDQLKNAGVVSPISIPVRRSSLPSPTLSPETSTRATRSYSESRRRSPIPSATLNTAPADDTEVEAGRKSDVVVVQTPSQPIIVEPPAENDTPSTPKKPIAPILNIIPATPLVLSPAAERDKQLGAELPPMPLISRRATGAPGLESTHKDIDLVLEEPQLHSTSAKDEPKAKRPSIVALPKKVRDSKLHPWWRPRYAAHEDDLHDRRPPLDDTAEEHPSKFTEAMQSNAAGKSKDQKNGRVVKKIKGTNLVIEFIGWRGLGDAVMRKRKKKPKRQKLNRKASSTSKAS